MAWRMDMPPSYSGDGAMPQEEWAVVYRDESEPSLPEYVCVTWKSWSDASRLGQTRREVTGGLSSFASASATREEAVDRAKSFLSQVRQSIPPENVLFWGVLRSH